MTMRSILENERSNSLRASAGISSPNLSSLTCSLKNVAWGGSVASISFAAKATQHLAPTDCQGTFKVSCVGLEERSSVIRYGNVSFEHSTALSRNCRRAVCS